MTKPATYPTKAYSVSSPTATFQPAIIERREPREDDVQIEILYCGVCHSDLHFSRNEWKGMMPATYPCVPGHEIVGRVARTGPKATRVKAGDLVGVGCMVGADMSNCPFCKAGKEQYSPTQIGTYGGTDPVLGTPTLGGYSASIVVQEHFALRVPAHLPLAGVAPLLCAGITTWSPLRYWKAGPGKKVGIVGLGGLGHMGVKFARALGAHVVAFTTSPHKRDDAFRLGAHEVVVSTNPDEMRAHANTFDFMLDCVSAEHDINAYLALLAPEATLCFVGAPEKPIPVSSFSLIIGRKSLAGSPIGSIAETQEMLDFCGQHNLTADVEVIPIQKINEAYDRLLKGDVKYRFSIDMASLKEDQR